MQLNLKKLLNEKNIIMDLKSDSKNEIIEEMIDYLVENEQITDKAAALKAVMAREKKMSTGMQNGVAIPHGKTDSVSSLVVALAIHGEGVDFQSLDGEAAKIFVMTVSPASSSGPHLQFLAEVSNLLNSPEARQAVLDASSWEGIVEIFSK